MRSVDVVARRRITASVLGQGGQPTPLELLYQVARTDTDLAVNGSTVMMAVFVIILFCPWIILAFTFDAKGSSPSI